MSEERGAVLITGTSTGIGRAVALRLDGLGYRVFAGVRRERDGESLRSEASSNLTPIILDVTDGEHIERARARVEADLNGEGLFGLINNAGNGIAGPLEMVPTEEIRRVFDVHYFGLIDVTKAFLPLLRKGTGGARIVNMSSIASLNTTPFHGPYSSAKRAINGFSEALRLELHNQSIQVSSVICGCVQTPIWQKGREKSAAVAETYPPAFDELYGSAMQALRDHFVKLGEQGITADRAAAVISRAITDKRAKHIYFVGPDAYVLVALHALVHGRLKSWLTLRTIGIS